jgi:hypothetical protein
MARIMSPNAALNERIGEDEALVLLSQGGRENWSAAQVRRFADSQYRLRTAQGTTTQQNEQAEGFRRMAYNISISRKCEVLESCSNPHCPRFKSGTKPLCSTCRKLFNQ